MGRIQRFDEETVVVASRVPMSKKRQFKDMCDKKLRQWEAKKLRK